MGDYSGCEVWVVLFFLLSPVVLYFLVLSYFVVIVATYLEFVYFSSAGSRCFRRGQALIGTVITLFAAIMLTGQDRKGVILAGVGCLVVYLYSSWRSRTAPLWLEWVMAGALSACLGLDVYLGYHFNSAIDWALGFAPVALNLILLLADRLLARIEADVRSLPPSKR